MADSKITALASISTSTDPAVDPLVIVDVSDTSMAASGTSKKVTLNNLLSSSPTATGNFTITGALTSGTTTLVAHAAGYTGKVGIGTATPADTLDVNGRVTALRYLSSSSSASLPSYAVAAGNGIYNSGSNQIGFAINSANAMTLNASGNLVFPSAKGIDFSAVTGGTGTATGNVLNDYEEGTWTGTLTGGTTNPTTPVTATGKYTKIGRQVSITIYFQNVSTVGASGAVAITGLPFTEDGSRANGTAACYGFDFNSGTSVFVNVGVTTLYYTSMLTNSNWRDVNHSAGVGRYLQANVIYYV